MVYLIDRDGAPLESRLAGRLDVMAVDGSSSRVAVVVLRHYPVSTVAAALGVSLTVSRGCKCMVEDC